MSFDNLKEGGGEGVHRGRFISVRRGDVQL